MSVAVKAVYVGGVFKPTEPVELRERTEVEVLIPESRPKASEESGWSAYERLAGIWKGEPEGSSVAEDHDEYLHK